MDSQDWHLQNHKDQAAQLQAATTQLQAIAERLARLETFSKVYGAIWGTISGAMVTIGAAVVGLLK
jgi:hypothetical protein